MHIFFENKVKKYMHVIKIRIKRWTRLIVGYFYIRMATYKGLTLIITICHVCTMFDVDTSHKYKLL